MKDDRVYLLHIRDAIQNAFDYTAGGESVFLTDSKTRDAVVRTLEVIGEATKNMSHKLKNAHPDIPWKQIAGMRDKMIHEYFGVDYRLVWDVVQKNLPPLKDKINSILGNFPSPQ